MRLQRRSSLTLTLLVLSVFVTHAHAWNHTGHRVSAYIAYQQLTPEKKARVNELLRHHPRYEQDLLKNLPVGADPELWAFMTAATWPDMIRSPAHPLSRKHNRSRWHYINFIFIPAGHEDRVERPHPPSERWVPGAEPDRILQAMERCRRSSTPGDSGDLLPRRIGHTGDERHRRQGASMVDWDQLGWNGFDAVPNDLVRVLVYSGPMTA